MQAISQSEQVVMDIIWSKSPISAKEIVDQVQQTEDWHEKTIKTLLNRLLKKQAISYQKQGREYLYYPIIEKQTFVSKESQSFLGRLFDGSLPKFVSAFTQQESLSKEEIAELEQVIERMKQQSKDDQ